MYDVCGNGRRPLGLVACGLLPQHTERGTVLQTATRSVNNVKFYNHKIKLHFLLDRRNDKGGADGLKFITPVRARSVTTREGIDLDAELVIHVFGRFGHSLFLLVLTCNSNCKGANNENFLEYQVVVARLYHYYGVFCHRSLFCVQIR